ncbi:DoxX family protein [Candidatus Woesearchaeota archaeon]|nr:MAG: DoxX family protein [Candidatus Woesearchaeota archaeon]
MKIDKQATGLLTLRLALGVVFLWFGIDKFLNQSAWSGWLPEWLIRISPVNDKLLIFAIGAFETALGAMIALGIYARHIASIASIFLISIILTTGYNEIAIRDAGLMLAGISIALLGAGKWSITKE